MRIFFIFAFFLACVLACDNFQKHVNKFCVFAKETKTCTKPNAASLAAACCAMPGKCNSREFPMNDVCCFTKQCLDRCYPGKNYNIGQVY